MECRAKLRPLLRANARRVLPFAPGGRRGIYFPPGPTLCSSDDDERDRVPKPRRWFSAAYARLLRHAASIPTAASSSCWPHAAARAAHFDALAGEFVSAWAASGRRRGGPWPGPLRPTSLSSLTRVCDVLGVSAQRRKAVRLTVCPQVTQHHTWRGALDAVLRDLQADVAASLDPLPPSSQMAEQIATACTRFLSATGDESSSTPSWMRPAPFKKPKPAAGSSSSPAPASAFPAKKWQEVLDMFTDLAKTLDSADADPLLAAAHAGKVEAMKEGLYQIRDVAVERDVAFKEARRQDCLVQYRLSKGLGHSSRCLFTLLLFYLYGTVRDIDVHLTKCISCGKGGDNVAVHAVIFLTQSDELAVRAGIKQLSQALGVFRFVWEAAHSHTDGATDSGKEVSVVKKKTEDTKGVLELQGHLWGFGVEEKELTYRGEVFHVHQIQMP
ncbi:hypothetical protein QOZ80_9BG0701670 [Eleusine coracana subsp. coracana]|nr:hypothetical protein QOZ80_9BG0701670 [Eleusine coracana subsp. coracana]